MALFGDIVGDDADAVARATSEVVRIANARAGEGFVAVSAEARKKFWLDRKRTAAISKHTNAFKINEDVVIPLPRMGEYTEGIERINIELQPGATSWRWSTRSRRSSATATCRSARATTPARSPSAELLEDRVQQALALLRERARAEWRHWLDRPRPRRRPRQRRARYFELLQDHTLRASWKTRDPRAAAGASSPARR